MSPPPIPTEPDSALPTLIFIVTMLVIGLIIYFGRVLINWDERRKLNRRMEAFK